MATKRIKRCVVEDELVGADERGTARQESPIITRIAHRSSDEHLNSEESELAEAGLARLPATSLPDSFWKMPAPRVSFEEAVSTITSERDEG